MGLVRARPDDRRTAHARRPRRTSITWGVRAPLVAWLAAEAERAAADLGRYRVLDIGCGFRPYEPLFAPHASEYVGVDLDNPRADLQGTVEAVPVADGSFDLVLCTQVLEHADDPAAAVRELRRIAAPGGRVLASTHGTAVYHPAPNDHWRWTHTGLEQLFRRNAEWRSVTVTPGAGTAGCLALLLATYVDQIAQKAHARPLGYPAVWLLNSGGALVDRLSRTLREPVPGTIFANYHVVADVPSAGRRVLEDLLEPAVDDRRGRGGRRTRERRRAAARGAPRRRRTAGSPPPAPPGRRAGRAAR